MFALINSSAFFVFTPSISLVRLLYLFLAFVFLSFKNISNKSLSLKPLYLLIFSITYLSKSSTLSSLIILSYVSECGTILVLSRCVMNDVFNENALGLAGLSELGDRKSTRLNSSHVRISYAVFCLKKK